MNKIFIPCLFFLFLSSFVLAQTVYITESGKKYHTSFCSYLSNIKISIELSEAKAKGLTPCSRCNPDSKVDAKVDSKNKS